MTTLMAVIILILVGVLLLYAAVGMRSHQDNDTGKGKSKKNAFDDLSVQWAEDGANVPPIMKNMMEHLVNNPNIKNMILDAGLQHLNQETGVTKMLYEGRVEDAIKAYQDYTHMDYFSARDAVHQIADMLNINLPDNASADTAEQLAKLEEDSFNKPKRSPLDESETQ